ncbi:MAG: Gfo/Idh/MocA family oxidoreductase [Candidatus Marinimicrobia bacterium]|nr:Gfo/Idh/MocA family oxidoreductase [Candidatus Neomarinimicrobiota bacterium]
MNLHKETRPEDAPPLRFAVVGCGMLAQSQHLPNLVRSRQAALHTCCDLSPEILAHCRQAFHPAKVSADYHQAIADPEIEAVCIATTEKFRLPVIEAAAAAGKPVYCEKPVARTLAELYAIQRLVRAAGIPFCAGHNRRSAPALLDARKIFRAHMEQPRPCPWRFDREGAARPPRADDGTAAMAVRVNDDWYSWKAWVFDAAQAPHGPMLFEMTHFTDICNWFLAAEPEEVTALEQGPLASGIVVRYQTGELATLMMTGNGTFGYPKELYELFGRGGAVIIDHLLEVRTAGLADVPARMVYPLLNDRHPDVGAEGGLAGWLAKKQAACQDAVERGDPMLSFAAEPDKGHARALDRFVDEIRGRGPQVCGIDEAVAATEVAFAAIRSAQEKRAVRIEELRPR